MDVTSAPGRCLTSSARGVGFSVSTLPSSCEIECGIEIDGGTHTCCMYLYYQEHVPDQGGTDGMTHQLSSIAGTWMA